MPLLLRIVAILLLRAGPQHLPYSLSLLATLTLLYLASGVLVLTTSMSIGQAAVNMVLDTAVLFAFSYFSLTLLKYKARFVQMVSALAGIGIVYHLLAWPLFVQIHNMQPQDQGAKIAALLMLLLVSWQVLVFAHVFRHAMQMSMMRALALSFGYLFLSMAAAEVILPGS
jgi:hypothetical protein